MQTARNGGRWEEKSKEGRNGEMEEDEKKRVKKGEIKSRPDFRIIAPNFF